MSAALAVVLALICVLVGVELAASSDPYTCVLPFFAAIAFAAMAVELLRTPTEKDEP